MHINKFGLEETDNTVTDDMRNNVPCFTSNDNKQYVISNNRLVLVYTYADWCGPCKQFSDKYTKLCFKYNGQCLLVKENADNHLVNYKDTPIIRGIPSFSFYVNGEHNETFSGSDEVRINNKIMELIQTNGLNNT